MEKADIIVIGGGHAGCEAAYAACKMGMKTWLITMTIDNIAQMSCNPAIGGVAKGHLVKEIDALGGLMGLIADETGIQFRKLNTSKGAAVRATRCQSDMIAYRIRMREELEKLENLKIVQREITGLIWNDNKVGGVITSLEERLESKAVIITTGTFLNGRIHIGKKKFDAGRAWEFSSKTLSEDMQDHGILMGRLKTGTTPRLNKNTINYDCLEVQHGDPNISKFSFWESEVRLRQVPCHITYTNSVGHKIIADNLDKSSMYGGEISSVGPRYCPSIEDKIVKFPDKDQHQIFLEPTSLNSVEIYPNGMSTSMPHDVQIQFMRSIKGLENVEIMRPGYAIEYDFAFPHQMKLSLETKEFDDLFLAGQINGTTGYEEAAAQGLIAGINAVLKIKGKEEFVLGRNESYIGVLIDDLTSKGTNEPYRMFTSRAEYRLLLREDNADLRLSQKGFEVGLLSQEKYDVFQQKMDRVKELEKAVVEEKIDMDENALAKLASIDLSPPSEKSSIYKLLKMPGYGFSVIESIADTRQKKELERWSHAEKSTVEADVRYEGYLKRQETQLKNYLKIESIKVPESIDYKAIGGLSHEVTEKLMTFRPQTLGQAGKISGVTPAAITILMVYLKNQKKKIKQAG